MTKRASVLLRVTAVLVIAAELAFFLAVDRRIEDIAAPTVSIPEVRSAVPELSRQRHNMRLAEQALREGDGATAVQILESTAFGSRPVESYRRYFLANAKELVGERSEARSMLARLWAEDPRFAPRIDVAFHLAELFEEAGDWSSAANVLRVLLDHESATVRDTAYQIVRRDAVALGDPTILIAPARALTIRYPESNGGRASARDLAGLGVVLSRRDRIERAGQLAARADTDTAMAEIQALRREGTSLKLELARVSVVGRQGKREEADRIVNALLGQNRQIDRELLTRSWTWWAEAAREIESRGWRTIRVRRRSGTKRGRPVYTWSTRRVKRSLRRADRRRLAAVNTKLLERGEQLLSLDVDDQLRAKIHRRLALAETEPRRQAQMEEHVKRLVEIDPLADDLLQLTWDEGWAAWKKRDLDTARERFAFIFRTYQRPNVLRQARYWYARCLEESGEKEEGIRHFEELQKGVYADLYTLLAASRWKAPGENVPFIPFKEREDDWISAAEREMPDELRLAWELSLLGLYHDAKVELRRNSTKENRQWRYSILARIHHAERAPLLVSHAIRQAYPEIGTVEQDRVPVHFLRMYYPQLHRNQIDSQAARLGLDSALVRALILQESGYDPGARSSAGAVGLMQLMAPTAREVASRFHKDFDENRLVDPDYNIEIGTSYLSSLMTELDGNPVLTLAAYNGGIGNVRRWLRRELKGRAPDELVESIPFSETRGYVKKVVFYRSVYARLLDSADRSIAP